MIDIRLPQITGKTEKEQLQQVNSYLYQLATQLQWALQSIDTTNNSMIVSPTPKSLTSNSYGVAPIGEDGGSAYATFNSIKALIIKSAEIVDAYYQEINRRLESVYVAQSDFGDFAERTSQEITETSTSTIQRFENLQIIITNQESNIASIAGNLQTIGEDISYTQNDVITLKSNVDSLDSYVASVEGEVIALDTSLQSTKTDVNGRIDDTNGSVAGLGAGLNDAKSRIAEVDQDLQDSKETINDTIQGVQNSVTGVNALLEDAKAQLRGSIDDIQAYVTGLQEVIIGVTAYLKSGLLYYTDAGIPVYGLEIGQSVRDEVAGTEVFNKYARFTSEKLSFYDTNGNEVAYISDKKLFIRISEITSSFKIGGLISLVMPTGDVVKKWIGG